MGLFNNLKESIKSKVTTIVDKVLYSPNRVEKTINKFNDKIDRVVTERPDIANIQPAMIIHNEEITSLPMERIKSEIQSMKRYVKKGAEKPITSATGNTVTQWQKKEVEIKVDVINAEREKELKKVLEVEVTSQGKETGLKRGEMGSERVNSLKPKKFDFDKIKSGKEWDMFVKSVDRQASLTNRKEKQEQYKKNYIDSMERVYGEHARELIDMIKELPAETVVETYFAEQEASIDFHYSPEEMETKLDILDNIWQGVYNNYLDETDR